MTATYLHATTNTDVAIYRESNGDVVLVGDAHGAWAVRVRA